MKKAYSLVLFVFTIIFVSSIGAIHGRAASMDDKVIITLHKTLFESGVMPDPIKNDGVTNPFNNKNLLKAYTGLNGATFSVYDVSEQFYKLRISGNSISEAQKKLANVTPKNSLDSGITSTYNGEEGIWQVQLPAKDRQGRDAIYLFLETKLPPDVKQEATPLVVVLPVQNSENKEMKSIDLYPKSEERAHQNPPLTKIVTNTNKNFSYGEQVSYKITTIIPSDVWTYDKYQILDSADSDLFMNLSSLKISLSTGKLLKNSYQVISNSHGFSVQLDGKKMKSQVGKKLIVTYKMTLIGNSTTKSEFDNQVTLIPGTSNTRVTSHSFIRTGGKYFSKVDFKDTTKKLANAQFVVEDSKGRFLKRGSGINKWIYLNNINAISAKDNQLFNLTSSKEGLFSINGLNYGNYKLLEIKSPKGYKRNNDGIPFSVEKGSYELGSQLALQIVNQPSNKKKTIQQNVFTGLFPKTGAKDQENITILGVIILLIVLIFIIKRYQKS